ncbi:hypothetical protein IEQ11_22550 [Lysobacter capsici]|uniref:hypothetical protein n=1 Tax=Lysobacter capsici TaxID=435897 RepID=UPI00177FC928|nr:hypothetical protein [Lysobacter capsici]UOF14466.1 hypothetical protein IEQ11_22550 [Lysobacter capsici]
MAALSIAKWKRYQFALTASRHGFRQRLDAAPQQRICATFLAGPEAYAIAFLAAIPPAGIAVCDNMIRPTRPSETH